MVRGTKHPRVVRVVNSGSSTLTRASGKRHRRRMAKLCHSRKQKTRAYLAQLLQAQEKQPVFIFGPRDTWMLERGRGGQWVKFRRNDVGYVALSRIPRSLLPAPK